MPTRPTVPCSRHTPASKTIKNRDTPGLRTRAPVRTGGMSHTAACGKERRRPLGKPESPPSSPTCLVPPISQICQIHEWTSGSLFTVRANSKFDNVRRTLYRARCRVLSWLVSTHGDAHGPDQPVPRRELHLLKPTPFWAAAPKHPPKSWPIRGGMLVQAPQAWTLLLNADGARGAGLVWLAQGRIRQRSGCWEHPDTHTGHPLILCSRVVMCVRVCVRAYDGLARTLVKPEDSARLDHSARPLWHPPLTNSK